VDCRHLPEEVMAHLYNTLAYDKDTLPDYMAQRGEDLRARPMEIDLSDGSQGGTTSVTGAGIRIDGRSAATVPGLFAAGNCADHNRGLWAATTGGFHAGRQAAEFAKTAARVEIDAEAALDEFADFKAPLDLADGMSFTEFEDTIRKVMYENPDISAPPRA
jgi:succinate dehydrogenase/fumarate reductase flavoprotein subunit